MHLRYDDDFVEAAGFLCASGRRPGAHALQVRRFHSEREKCYAVADPDERNAAFFQVHLRWFREWGLEQLLTGLLKDYPLLPGALNVLAFRQARGKSEEGAEMYVQSRAGVPPAPARFQPGASEPVGQPAGGAGGTPALLSRNAMVALRLERLEHDEPFLRFLRHEFMHLEDMVNPAFAYSPQIHLPTHNHTQQRIIRERYRLLWDITIDGRITRTGRDPITDREQHQGLFDRAFFFWPEEKRRQVFEAHWEDRATRHENLLALAADPRDLSHAQQPLPGGSCPLCDFPTFEWTEVPALNPGTLATMCAQFPHWTPEQGACKRCVEIYEIAGKFEAPATMVM